MNKAAARLGMTQTTYVNPNGLPADEQITSARDQAILARAIIPRIAGIRNVLAHLGDQVRQARHAQLQYADRPLSRHRRHEDRLHLRLRLQHRCDSAKRNGKPADRGDAGRAVRRRCARSRSRRCWSADFQNGGFNWLAPSLGNVDSLGPIKAAPPNLRDEICGKKRKRPAAESEDLDDEDDAEAALPPGIDPELAAGGCIVEPAHGNTKPSTLLGALTPSMEPIEVFLGATKGAVPVQVADGPKKQSQKEELSRRRRSPRHAAAHRLRPVRRQPPKPSNADR